MWPAPVGAWLDIKTVIAGAKKNLSTYSESSLLRKEEFSAPAFLNLKNKLHFLTEQINRNSKNDFSEYEIIGTKSYFEIYPIETAVHRVLSEDLEPIRSKLKSVDSAALEVFANTYSKKLLGDKRWNNLGNIYMSALFRESASSKKPAIAIALEAFQGAKNKGFSPTKINSVNFTFSEVTSKTLLKEGQIDFPAEVEIDIPVPVNKGEVDELLNQSEVQNVDYIIVFNVALAKAHRRIATKTGHESRFIAVYQTQPNPDYNMAQNKVNSAQANLQSAQMQKMSTDSQYCYGAGCLGKAIAQIAAAVQVGKAKDAVSAALSELQSTPMTKQVPVYRSYRYDVAEIKATKNMTVHYYVIDRRNSTFFKSTFDVEEKKTFQTVFSVHDKDPNNGDIKARYSTESEVAAWEDRAATVRLSQLTGHYLANQSAWKKLPSLISLRREMLRDKNTAIATYNASKFDARPLNDPRFDNVVVVIAPQRKALGSGFFVRPDTVLTNWHVVENAKFVEMKTYDGQETFGKVIARDVMRDLALIKAQNRGKPVTFYSRNKIDLGQTVEAIGHPKGLEFSITRGVISAIRRDSPTTLPQGSRKNVLFIQTDAPINPGNSGGPLFLGDKVVGVNTQKLRKAESLNFAVHYSEVQAFLKENLEEVN